MTKELKLDKIKINMKPIKQLGEHTVDLNFGHGISTKIKVIVEAQDEKVSK